MDVYAPPRSISARILRRLTSFQSRECLSFDISRPIVSFSFDDCPKSVILNGLAPMEAEGWRSTLYIAGGLIGTRNHHGEQMSWQDVRDAQKAGHEIGCHSFSHVDGTQISLTDMEADLMRNNNIFEREGIQSSATYAYPYGQMTANLKADLGQVFNGLRGIKPGVMRKCVDLNEINSTALFTGKRVKSAIKQIHSLKNKPGWMTLFTHDIRDNSSEWGCTKEEFLAVIEAVKSVDAIVLPVNEAISYLKLQSS